jgi:hypothetical protein
MIDVKLLRDQGVLIVAPIDKLESVDFEQLRLLVDPHIEKHGELKGLLIDAGSFAGWEDFSSMLSHIHFVEDYETKIERVAAVTDSAFLAILPKVAEHFVGAEVRQFDYQDRDDALEWLRSG